MPESSTGTPVVTTPEGRLTGAKTVIIKKFGDKPMEVHTLGGRPKMTFLTDANKTLLPDFGGDDESSKKTMRTTLKAMPKDTPKETP